MFSQIRGIVNPYRSEVSNGVTGKHDNAWLNQHSFLRSVAQFRKRLGTSVFFVFDGTFEGRRPSWTSGWVWAGNTWGVWGTQSPSNIAYVGLVFVTIRSVLCRFGRSHIGAWSDRHAAEGQPICFVIILAADPVEAVWPVDGNVLVNEINASWSSHTPVRLVRKQIKESNSNHKLCLCHPLI